MMKRRSLALVVGIFVAVVGLDSTIARSVSSPSYVSAPVFNVPLVLPPATVGTKYTYSFCDPVTARACGGPFAQNQLNPAVGSGGPYIFTIKLGRGFMPKGLKLNPRTGIMTGVVATSAIKNNQSKTYRFTICASDRSPGMACSPTQLVVEPSVVANAAFVGTWIGTYNRTTDATDRCGPDIPINDRAIQVEIARSGTGFQVVVRYYETGIRICQGSLGEDGRFYLQMNPFAATTISGDSDGQDFVFTLTGANEILGNGQGWWGQVEITLNRK